MLRLMQSVWKGRQSKMINEVAMVELDFNFLRWDNLVEDEDLNVEDKHLHGFEEVIGVEDEKRGDDNKILSGASWHKGEEELVGCRSAIGSGSLQCSDPTIKDVWGMGLDNHLSLSVPDCVEEVGESDWASQVDKANSKLESHGLILCKTSRF
ncbi:hypothetical protein V6N11_025866 [Hibiscus sabdariffa]|uniref:Uncharacterized protein n=1 Tax=Hibiscus sabdariffa TaxID=183260 RepID=A0ABR2SUT7_9ROSI